VTVPLTIPPQPPDSRDQLTGYAWGWLGFVAYFAVLEGYAIVQDSRHRGDRVKRTLSANLRFVFATDSVTGAPLRVPLGKVRRLAFASASTWLQNHIERPGSM
jgi:hypothetical protein